MTTEMMRNAEAMRKVTQTIGKALVDMANEAYDKRIATMLSRPFDEVVEAIMTYKETRYNKANGYFADEAISYLDKQLEIEHQDIWLAIEDTCDADWFLAVNKLCRW